MESFLMVALGGALGSAGRYALSLLPNPAPVPLWTLAANLLGALLIGFVAGVRGGRPKNDPWTLFWKTGVCGGFTTFSTFSLESWALLEGGRAALAGLYVLLSLGLCLLGVGLGQWWGRRVLGA